MSALLAVSRQEIEVGVERLRADLVNREWRSRNEALLDLDAYDGGYGLLGAELE